MPAISREFQIFAKPAGARCNLACDYCYYLKTAKLYPDNLCMPTPILEEYILQHIEATTEPVITFSWHGGEPTLLGLDYFRTIAALQRKHKPANRRIANGIQTNGTLLNDDWCRFFKEENYFVGISIDGPAALHDLHRRSGSGAPTHARVMRGYNLLQKYAVACEILCVVHADNVMHPLAVYSFFRRLGATHIGFLPFVERLDAAGNVSGHSVPAEAFGDFLIAVFDEWQAHDIGTIKVQMFEEAIRPAFGQEHTLCIFKETCGGVPVMEHSGDFYACDHYVDDAHRLGNIMSTPLAELLDSPAQRAFGQRKLDSLPASCRACEVRAMCNGGCPKDRFIRTPDGQDGLNYLCAGYKRFFTHCLPFVRQIAALWKQQQADDVIPAPATHDTAAKVGRNDPCPCGSGKKYKNCCMDQ